MAWLAIRRYFNKSARKYDKLLSDFEILKTKAKKNEVFFEHTIEDVH